jgi:AraC family transcriptional regulator
LQVLSRFHFDRLVRAALDEPSGAFRRRILLERSAHRLHTSRDSVIDVASEAGYDSPDAFGRAFLRAYGVSPTLFRRSADLDYRLPTPNGIHFHQPGALRLPAPEKTGSIDVLTRMYDHHVWLTAAIIDRLDALDPVVLDRPIDLPVEGIDEHPTLRLIAERLVRQLEMWVTAVSGRHHFRRCNVRATADLLPRRGACTRAHVLGGAAHARDRRARERRHHRSRFWRSDGLCRRRR